MTPAPMCSSPLPTSRIAGTIWSVLFPSVSQLPVLMERGTLLLLVYAVRAKCERKYVSHVGHHLNCWAQHRFSGEKPVISWEMRLSAQMHPARIAAERLFGGLQYHSISVLSGVTGVPVVQCTCDRLCSKVMRQGMRTPIRRRQLRGLVLHHRRHPAEHPRRLVNRTARWEEPPVDGMRRWCYELTASSGTRWHRYYLDACRVAFGQHPDEAQHTLCEM